MQRVSECRDPDLALDLSDLAGAMAATGLFQPFANLTELYRSSRSSPWAAAQLFREACDDCFFVGMIFDSRS